MKEITISRIAHFYIAITIQIIGIRINGFQRYFGCNFGNRNPAIIKIIITHSISYTEFFQFVDSILSVFLIPGTYIIQMLCTDWYFHKQSLHVRLIGRKHSCILVIILLYFSIRNFISQLLINQLFLISMHYQCFSVRSNQFIYFHVIGNVTFCFLIQKHILYPIMNIFFSKPSTILSSHTDRHGRLQIFLVQELMTDFHQRSLSFMVYRLTASC